MPAWPASNAQHLGTLADGRALVRVLCEAEPVALDDGTQWVHIMPLGPFVEARDGRTFQVSDATGVAARSELPMLVDWEHRSESFFGDTKAAGWVEELYVEDGVTKRFPRPGVWGRSAWTSDGATDVKGKAYRFLSPVLILDAETRDVQAITSVALTNRPALHMQGLDSYREQLSARFGQLSDGAKTMKPENVKLLLAALGLADGATDEQVVEAAKAARQPAVDTTSKPMIESLSKQLSEANARVAELEKNQAEHAQAAFAAEVKSTLDQASKEGKIPPAARAGYEAMCKTPEMFAAFKSSVLPNLVVIGEKAPKSTPKGGDATSFSSLDPDAVARLRKAGMSDDKIREALSYRQNRHNRASARAED